MNAEVGREGRVLESMPGAGTVTGGRCTDDHVCAWFLSAAPLLLPLGVAGWMACGERLPLSGLVVFVITVHAALIAAGRRRLAASGHGEFKGRPTLWSMIPGVHLVRRERVLAQPDADPPSWLWFLTMALSSVTFAATLAGGLRGAAPGQCPDGVTSDNLRRLYDDVTVGDGSAAQDCAGALSGSNRSGHDVDYTVMRRGDRVFVEMRPRRPQ